MHVCIRVCVCVFVCVCIHIYTRAHTHDVTRKAEPSLGFRHLGLGFRVVQGGLDLKGLGCWV